MGPQALDENGIDNAETVSSGEPFQLLDACVLLWQHRWLLGKISLGTAVIVSGVVLAIANRFTASTILLPPQQNSSSSSLLGQLSGSPVLSSVAGAGLGLKNPSDMYVALFRIRTVEDAVILRFGLADRYHAKKPTEARAAFERHSTVTLGAKDGLIRVTVTDTDPNKAAEIANGYVAEFKRLSATLAISEASQRRVFFQNQLLEAKGNLASAEEALKQSEQSNGVLQIDSQSRSLIETAATLRAQVVAKEVELQAMQAYATPENPDAVLAQEQLVALKQQLAKLAGSSQASDADLLVPKGKVPEATMEYVRRLRDVKYNETISELIAKQLELARLDEARQGSIIQVVEPAVAPDKKSAPFRSLIVVAATFLSLVCVSSYLILRRIWKDTKEQPYMQRRLRQLTLKV